MMLVPVVFLTAAAGYIAIRQARHHLPPIFEWPTFFFRARTLAWIAVVVLAADAAIEIVIEPAPRPRAASRLSRVSPVVPSRPVPQGR